MPEKYIGYCPPCDETWNLHPVFAGRHEGKLPVCPVCGESLDPVLCIDNQPQASEGPCNSELKVQTGNIGWT